MVLRELAILLLALCIRSGAALRQYPAPWAPTYIHLHIPKAAGTSFYREARHHLQHAPGLPVNFHSLENCYYSKENQGVDEDNQSVRLLALLREPRSLMLAEYFHCTASKWAAPEDIAKMPGTFEEWVEAWMGKRRDGVKKDFCCYNPVDPQSYRFVCESDRLFATRDFVEVNETLALQNMAATHFVGLVEYYQESICLLHAMERGELPRYCNCTDQHAWNSFPQAPLNTGMANHSVANYSGDILDKIDSLTHVDRKLYAAAVERFGAAIAKVSDEFHTQILCRALPQSPQVLSAQHRMRGPMTKYPLRRRNVMEKDCKNFKGGM